VTAQHFWKYVSNFRKHGTGSVQLEVDGAHFVQPSAVADAFAKHFQSVYNKHCPVDITPLSRSSEFESLASVSDADVCKAIKKVKLNLLDLTASLGLSDMDVQ
jgi:hypothetical protein